MHVGGRSLHGRQATTGESSLGIRGGVRPTRMFRRKPERKRWERSNLDKTVGVVSRKNEDGPRMDGEKLKAEVVMMDKENGEKLEIRIHCAMSRRHDRHTPKNVERERKENSKVRNGFKMNEQVHGKRSRETSEANETDS